MVAAAGWLLLTSPLAAQPPFRTYRSYLEAQGEEVSKALGATKPDPRNAIDSLILAERGLLARYFGFDVLVEVSDRGTGTQSHPDLGIVVDRGQIRRIQTAVGSQNPTTIVRFVLAHEWAHMQQFKRDSAELGDATLVRTLECDADMWAGFVVTTALTDSGTPPAAFQPQAQLLGSAAFQLGTSGWSLQTLHPTPEQRILCVTVGQTAALDLGLSRIAKLTGDTTAARIVSERRRADPSALSYGEPVHPWIRAQARLLVGRDADTRTPTPEYIRELTKIARATHTGPGALEAAADDLRVTGARECLVERTVGAVQFRCEFTVTGSAAIMQAMYDNWKGMTRIAVGDVGWLEQPEQRLGLLKTATFYRADRAAFCVVTLSTTGTITIAFAAQRR